MKSDPQLKAIWEAVRLTADHMLTEPVVVHRKDGRRLLGRSREALGRMMHLGFAFRLTGDKRYADRAMAEMKAMAAMPDWNPSHFLDTAEMTLAIAVGYDWLYEQLSPELRQASREAIEKKGLGPVSETRGESSAGNTGAITGTRFATPGWSRAPWRCSKTTRTGRRRWFGARSLACPTS